MNTSQPGFDSSDDESDAETLDILSVSTTEAIQDHTISTEHEVIMPSIEQKSLSIAHKINELKSINSILTEENKELQAKNEHLEDTVSWMHDLIWDLIKQLHTANPDNPNIPHFFESEDDTETPKRK